MARWLLSLLLLGLLVQAPSWAGESLMFTLETNQVDVDAGFAGIELKAAGTMDGPGDLVIKVTGPPQDVSLSREVRFGPFWIHGESVRIAAAPSLVYVYGSRPLEAILSPAERRSFGLVLDEQPLAIEPQLPEAAARDWRKAFYRLKANAGRYREDGSAIRVAGDRAFTLGIRLPGNLQQGSYGVEALFVKSGKVVDRNVRDFNVSLAGIERWVWDLAHEHAWLFGLVFTLVAAALGLFLNAVTYRAQRGA